MRKKVLMFLLSFLAFVGTAKADFTLSYNQDTNFWGDVITEYPSGVDQVITDAQITNAEVHCLSEDVKVKADGTVSVTFLHVNGQGSHCQHIVGVVLKNADGEIADYHHGKAGGTPDKNTYTLSGVTAGDYTLNFYVTRNGSDLVNKYGGTITVTGAVRRVVGSTAENKIFYHIKNVRSGKYANYEGAGVQFTQVTTPTLGSYWYLMEVADAENVPEGYKAYRIYNAANALAVENPGSGNMTENEGVTWPAKVYCIGEHTKDGITGVVIRSLGEDGASWNDAGGSGTKIANHNYNDPGSIWEFEKTNITESQLIQNAVAVKTGVLNTLATEATNTERYYYGYVLSDIETKKAEIEAISVSQTSLVDALTTAITLSKMTPLAEFERIAPKAGDMFTMVNKGRNSGKDGLVAFAADTDVKCLQSPFPYFDAVWTLVATETEGQFKLYNEKLKVYVGVLANVDNTRFQYVSDAEAAGVYELDNVNGYATFKRVGGGATDYLHQSNRTDKEIVRWDNGDCSQWRLVKAFGPELTTDANNPICYALKSGRDGNYYFTLDNNKVKLFNNKSIATDETHWYFMLDESGNLKMYSKSDNKAMGYLTGTSANTRLTNDVNATEYDNNTYILYFAPYNQTNYNGAWFALKPSRNDTYVSNHGGTANYMGFHTEFNDGGTRIAFESIITYTLTDKVGNRYTGTYSGTVGETTPTFTGLEYTLTNEEWNGNNFTATIEFSNLPFLVSSASVTNATMISSFKDGGGSYPGAGRFKWYAEEDEDGDDDVKILRDASVTKDNLKSYSWAIYPELQNDAFVFSIKSIKTGDYIKATKDFGNASGNNDEGTVILSDTPTKFSVDSNNSLYFYAQGRNQYLSWGSVNDAPGFLGVHTKTVTAGHNGITNSFHAAVIDLTSKDDFVNGEIYTFVTARGWMGAKDGNNNVISTAKASHGLTGSYSDPMFQWTVYKSKDGYYFLYNLGKQQFMGVQSTNNASIPFAVQPAGKNLTFKDNGQTTGYPIMFSTDNAGVANHSTSYGDGLITWTKGWSTLDDPGSNHKVSYVGKLSDEEAQAIADKVEFYLNNVTALDQLSNTATYKVYGERGFIYVNDNEEPAAVNTADGDTSNDIDYDVNNDKHRYAIVTYEEKSYLYSVSAKKFLIRNGNNGVALSDTPAETVTIESSSNATYPWIIKLGGDMINISNGGGHKNSIRIAGTSNPDEGARWAIFKVGDFTPDDALYVIQNYDRQLPVKAVVEGLEQNNPNTHFGNVRATSTSGSFSVKLKTANIDEVASLHYNGLTENTIDFTREYRGFEFLGYWLGDTELGKSFPLTEDLKNNITAENPLVAKFTATEAVTLFYDDDPFSYRIPAIGKTSTGRLIAVSDYRYSLDDIGRYNFGTDNPGIDLVIRMSDDNGKTWGETKTIAKGSCELGTDDCAYGDAAIAVVDQKVLVMGAAGDVMFGNGSATAHNRAVRIFSEDNGETWTKQDISETLFLGDDATIKNGYSSFFGSGRLAVDENYNGTGKARIYGALLLKKASGTGNYVIYTDDLGLTWHILGDSQDPIANQDEPKVEILPSGQILLSVRRGGGRQFNVFTYTDKATNAGSWDSNVNGCDNGGSNTCNGEPFLVDAKKADGSDVKLLLQSQPKGGSGLYDRRDVTIWYKEVTDANYTSAQIASDWTQGLQVSTQQSAYSAMALQDDGKIAFFFEEAPCYGDDHTKGYSMVYIPLTIYQITKGNYFASNADLNTGKTINVVLTDAQGNEYRDQLQSTLSDIANTLNTKYPFITLGDTPSVSAEGEAYTYTNTVTLPFKVSNNVDTYWYNIYYPTAGGNAPVYLGATVSTESYVRTLAYSNQAYGSSEMNTKNKEDNISWAIYSVDNRLEFIFKNKSTNKFIKVAGVASDKSQNVTFTEETEATSFGVEPDNASYRGDYALKTQNIQYTGYLCATSSTYGYATNFLRQNGVGTDHEGAWVNFEEAPDFDVLISEANAVLTQIRPLATGEVGMYSVAAVNQAVEAMENPQAVTKNTLDDYKTWLTQAPVQAPSNVKMYRLRNTASNKYMTALNNGNVLMYETPSLDASIFYLDADNCLLSYSQGLYLDCYDKNLEAIGTKWSGTFHQSHSGYQKDIVMYQNHERWTYGNKNDGESIDRGQNLPTGSGYDWTFEPVTSLPFTFKQAALGFATFCAPVNVQLYEGVVAYIAEIMNGEGNNYKLKMRRIVGDVVPANTPVLLYKENVSADVTVYFNIDNVECNFTANDLKSQNHFHPTIEAENRESGCTYYSLQKGSDNKLGFYLKDYGTLGGFKAWIKLDEEPDAQGARTFTIIFDGDDATGLKEALGIENENVEIYDLSGRRLDKPTKGINIVGGKLVIK